MDPRPRKHPRNGGRSSGEGRAPKRLAYSGYAVAVQDEKQRDYEDYSVAVVCALHFEMSAVRWMLDRQHHPLPRKEGDRNSYVLGDLSGHNVVIACLPGTQGKGAAAHVAADLERTFPRIQWRLLVGIGGGVPSDKHDIRLGDVVVSMPDGQYGGVVQYDLGKDTEDGFSLKGSLFPPPTMLRTAVGLMESDHDAKRNRIPEFISEMLQREPNLSCRYQRPSAESDILFRPGFRHPHNQDTCAQCDQSEIVTRPLRMSTEPDIHYGVIASGDRVIKSALKRDSIREKIGDVLCFEMEACGLVTELPYMVIRGISDYADSHKNDRWQPYAAAVAAGCTKELLLYLHVDTPPVAVPIDTEEDAVSSRCQIHGAAKFTEEQRSKLLESLEFDQFNARQKTIKLAHAKTCRWLLSKKEYLNWLDVTKLRDHHGLLWIKGNPGTGKSTIMNYAHINAKRKMKDKVVISFFFNARGTDLEKSTIGMYRSLLLQLVRSFPELRDVLLSCVETLELSSGTNVEQWQFTVESLKYMFREAIHSLRKSSLVCFIDALDECSEEEVRDMISFLRQVSENGDDTDDALRFQVCFSSRHYPHITIDRGLSLILEGLEGHDQDIANYIRDELRIGNNKTAEDIKDLLQEKARGVFMWVVLVVEILNREYDRGRIIGLQNRLQDIPSNLHELFRDILRRDANGCDNDALLLCIQWILFARQPLTPDQFYFAMCSGISPESLCEWDAAEITPDVVKRFILDSSKGLAETTRSKHPTVQFIHESVVDFLLKENGFSEIWGDIGMNFRGLSHERLKDCCVNYIKIDLSAYLQPNTEIPGASSKEAKLLRESVIQAFPLLEYATHNVLYHSDCAEETGIVQERFLLNFDMSKWVSLDNLLEKHQVRRHTQDVSMLYILAERNAPNLIRSHPSAMSYLEIEEQERYGTPLFAALAMGNRTAVQAFLDAHAAQRPSKEHLSELCNLYYQDDSRRSDLGRDFRFSNQKGILLPLIALDNDIIFQFVMDIYPDLLDDKYYQGQSPLSWAITNGHDTIVKLLLEKYQVDATARNKRGEPPLLCAVKKGNAILVKLLLKNSDVNKMVPSGRIALSYAAAAGDSAMFSLLLESCEANIDLSDKSGRSLISYAAGNGHKAMVELLIDRVDVDIPDEIGRTALSYAAGNGHYDTVRLLLGKANDNFGRTALSLAAINGHETTVKLLLETSETDINLPDIIGNTALSLAAKRGRETIVKLLLERNETDVSERDSIGQTPLFHAARYARGGIAKLLLERCDVDVNLQDIDGRTALMWAVEFQSYDVIKLLLEKADVNLQDDLGETPLSRAVSCKNSSIVELLLATEGVNVNSADILGGTPFSVAAERGYQEIGRLLLASNKVEPAILERYSEFCSLIRRGF